MEEKHEKNVSDATSSGYEVHTSSNRRVKERGGFHKEKLSDDAKHAKVLDTLFLQLLLNGVPFNRASINSPRVRTPAARKNEEVDSV